MTDAVSAKSTARLSRSSQRPFHRANASGSSPLSGGSLQSMGSASNECHLGSLKQPKQCIARPSVKRAKSPPMAGKPNSKRFGSAGGALGGNDGDGEGGGGEGGGGEGGG